MNVEQIWWWDAQDNQYIQFDPEQHSCAELPLEVVIWRERAYHAGSNWSWLDRCLAVISPPDERTSDAPLSSVLLSRQITSVETDSDVFARAILLDGGVLAAFSGFINDPGYEDAVFRRWLEDHLQAASLPEASQVELDGLAAARNGAPLRVWRGSSTTYRALIPRPMQEGQVDDEDCIPDYVCWPGLLFRGVLEANGGQGWSVTWEGDPPPPWVGDEIVRVIPPLL